MKRSRFAAESSACALLAIEVIGSLSMWAPIPIAWMWIGARVYDATGSLAADCGVAMSALTRVDTAWVALRRRSGHVRRQGALTQVVVVSATLGILLFLVWFYVLSHAFILPFMPSQ